MVQLLMVLFIIAAGWYFFFNKGKIKTPAQAKQAAVEYTTNLQQDVEKAKAAQKLANDKIQEEVKRAQELANQ